MTKLRTYTPSGGVSMKALPLTAATLVAGIVLAFVYAVALALLPFVKLSFLLALGFGFGLFFLTAWVGKHGHMRNRLAGVAIGLALAAVALAASYVASFAIAMWEFAKDNPEEQVTTLDLLRQVSISTWLESRIEGGWVIGSSSSGTGTGGILVYVVWGLEALMAFGGAVFGGWTVAGEPYCEKCQAWATEKRLGLVGLDRSAAEGLIGRGDVDGLLGLTAPPDGSSDRALSLIRTECPQCHGCGFLSVIESLFVQSKKGVEEKKKTLLTHAALTDEQVRRFDGKFDAAKVEQAAVPALQQA